MLSKTVTYRNATITAHRATVRSRLFADIIYTKLAALDWQTESFYFLSTFARFVTQCTVEGDMGFPLAVPTDDSDVMAECYWNFMKAGDDLYEAVVPTLNELDSDLNRPELSPVDEQKKTAGQTRKGNGGRNSRKALTSA